MTIDESDYLLTTFEGANGSFRLPSTSNGLNLNEIIITVYSDSYLELRIQNVS